MTAEARPVRVRPARRSRDPFGVFFWSRRRLSLMVLAVVLGTGVCLATSAGPGPTEPLSGSWRPPPGGYGSLRPVGSYASLPGDAAAARLVHPSTWEIRPDNAPANARIVSRLVLRPADVRMRAYDPRWNRYVLGRVTGGYTGTTDEIIQWAAAKWGLPDETLRTIAVMESDWHQSRNGDHTDDPRRCLTGYTPPDCPLSFGIAGVRSNSWAGSYPAIRDSTAANLDIVGGWLRGCYEGWVWWLRDHGNTSHGRYRSGDLWGCVGAWFSGNWHDGSPGARGAEDYIARAQRWYAVKPWLHVGY